MRCFTKFNCNDSKIDLNAQLDNLAPIVNKINENNPDGTLNEFYSLLTSTINVYAPLKNAISKTETFSEQTLRNQMPTY